MGLVMGYASGQSILWPYLPDWSQPVNETLAFLTDLMQAPTGGQQARALRDAPRRGFAFQSRVAGDERRIADAVRYDIGVKQFLLPIYPDVQFLAVPLASGATSIPCRTAGFDFAAAGGKAVLWAGINQWELVDVDSIAADHLTPVHATVHDWPAGTRLYPLRTARLAQPPQASYQSDEFATVQIQCAIDEPCDWPAAWPTDITYRGAPVIEWRNEESEDPTAEYDRLSTTVDDDTGPIYYTDLPDMPFRAQSQRFLLRGRDDHSAFRALLYALNGRAATLWVPSWIADLHLAQSVSASATQLTVPWMGYTLFGREQPGRQDIAIELADGTRLYRRITASTENGDTETLTLDAALGSAIDPAQIRQIGWLTLCAAASDTIQIQHETDADGIGIASIQWRAVKNDL